MSSPLPFYTVSDSGNYGMTGVNAGMQRPFFVPGSYNLKPAFATLFSKLSIGGTNPENAALHRHQQTLAEAAKRWMLNTEKLTGIDLHSSSGLANMLVLPYSTAAYQWYKRDSREFREVSTLATTKTISSPPTIVFYVSTAEAALFNVQEVIVNWSNSATKRARITAVDTATGAISIVAHGDGASAFSAVTDFFVSTTSLDSLELLKGGYAYNSSENLATARNSLGYQKGTVQSGQLQLMKETFREFAYFDENYKDNEAKNPQAQQSFEVAMAALHKQLSSTLLWGRKQSITASQEFATFSGIDESITNEVNLADGNLSISDLDQVLVDILGNTHGSNAKYGFCSFTTLQHIETIINTAGVQAGIKMTPYDKGSIGKECNVISYRGNEVFLYPVSDFNHEGARSFTDQTTTAGARRAGNLFIVDPASPKMVIGRRSDNGQAEFMKVDKNINTEEDKLENGAKHSIRTNMGFALVQPELCAKITNIQRPNTGG